MATTSKTTSTTAASKKAAKAAMAAQEKIKSQPKSKKILKIKMDPEKSILIKRFAELVEDEAARRGLSTQQFYAYMDITPSYWSVLRRGGSSTQKDIGEDLVRRGSKLMGISVLVGNLLSGRLKSEDLYIEVDHEDMLKRAYDKMKKDLNFSAFIPDELDWAKLSTDAKFKIVILYESASKNALLERFELLTNPA